MLSNRPKALLWFLSLSLLLHFLTFFSLDTFNFSNSTKEPLQDSTQKIEVTLIESPPKDLIKKQLVEQNAKTNTVDENARYLSKHNNKVNKETRARNQGDFKNAQRYDSKSANTKTLPKKQSPVSLKSFLPSSNPLKQSYSQHLEQQQPSPQTETQPVEDYSSSEASATNDYLRGVAEGDRTALNTKEFVFYSYYQRIRKKIRQQWEPNIKDKVQRLFLQGRRIAAVKDHVTQVIIILDDQGNLTGVQMLNGSGLLDLDQSAVEAFKAAEPFPNPPKDIIEDDGKIRIRWDFILEA